jgi:mRNA-degrading endonuclease RelE of RelBE toxin-antitoxin system
MKTARHTRQIRQIGIVQFLDLPPEIQGDVTSCLVHRLNRIFETHVSIARLDGPPYDVRELLESINPPLPLVMVDTALLVQTNREINPDVLSEYRGVWESDTADFPPVVIDSEDPEGVLCEGGHRSFSAFEAGVKAIRAVDVSAIDTGFVKRSLPIPYRVLLSDGAEHEYSKLVKGDQRLVSALLDRLSNWPEVSGVTALWGPGHGHFRVKTRGWRVIFHVDEAEKAVIVDKIAPRATAYEEYH